MFGASGYLPFFLAADEAPALAGGLPLVAYGGGSHSGAFAGLPFYASGDNGLAGALTLSLCGPSSAALSGALPLFAAGGTTPLAASLPLLLAQSDSGVAAGLPLYARGLGLHDGYFPATGALPLYLARDTAAALTLFAAAPGAPLGSGLSLYAYGGQFASGALPLLVPEVVGAPSAALKLYTHGF